MSSRTRFWNVLIIVAMVIGAVFVSPAQPARAANDLRISQVYGGGGNSNATYTHDFIELFNAGATAIDLTGYSVQYASASGTSWTNKTDLSGTIEPGGYYLIQEAVGTNSALALPTPDLTGTIAMSGSNGKVALVASTTVLPTGTCPGGLVDFVGYGTASACEGAATGGLSSTTAAIRNAEGCTDTDANAADFTVATPTPRNSGSPTHTCASDSAPAVASTTPDNNTTRVALDANIVITFSEAVNAAADWATITCADSGAHTVVVSGGATSFTLNPAMNFVNGEVCTVTVDAASVTDQDLIDPPDAMAGDYVFSFTTLNAPACGMPYTAIHAIQGNTDVPALTGVQTTEGFVTADYQGGGFNGFYLQAVSGTEDADEATSEGIFVYNNSFAVNAGDHVRLTGTVGNVSAGGFSNMTQISALSDWEFCGVGSVGSVAPTPVTVTLPEDADPTTYLERFEGMLVTFPETLVVQQNYFQGRYGQITLGDGRLFNLNNFSMGGDMDAPLAAVVLDDASTAQNPNPIPYLPSNGAVRAGNTVTGGLTGVLDNGQINTSNSATAWPLAYYRLQPLDPSAVTFDTTVNARSTTPPTVGGSLKIVGTNVLNYFTTLDDRTYPGPYSSSNSPRGADNAAEFTRQQAKIVSMLSAMDADVYSLMEIESWDGAYGGLGAVQALVDALNAAVGAGTYAVVADPLTGAFDPTPGTIGNPGGDYIQTALIYKTATVAPVGLALSSDAAIFDRSPFAQEFRELATGEEFVVVANHFKSKGSCPSNPADENADQGDGQGCWNAKREEQAAALLTFINTDLLPLDADVLVMGDLNSYGAEDPISVLTGGGLVNQVAANVPAAERYSYVFDGAAGYLDHALSTAALTTHITDVAFWHINADEPSVIDYNVEFKPVDLYQPDMFRASDHDPVLVGLSLLPPPQAVDDAYSVMENGTLTVNAAMGVLANDLPGDGSLPTVALVTDTAHGTLTLEVDGSFTYVPTPGYVGMDSFVYRLTNAPAGADDATVTITVMPLPRIWLPIIYR